MRTDLAVEDQHPDTELFSRVLKGKDISVNLVQANALATIHGHKGLFGPIGVGHGKTLIAVLSHYVTGSSLSVLFLPPGLCSQFMEVDIPYYFDQFDIDYDVFCLRGIPSQDRLRRLRKFKTGLVVFPYSLLSTAGIDDLLEHLRIAELVICDEAHYLKNYLSARTKKFLRFMDGSKAACAVMSGTMIDKSVRDYSHLSYMSLIEGSFIHQSYKVVNEVEELMSIENAPFFRSKWKQRSSEICELVDWGNKTGKYTQKISVQSQFRELYSARMKSTPGVVATSGVSVDCSLTIETDFFADPPKEMQSIIDDMVTKWETPDGFMIDDSLEYGRYLNQLINGFYYRLYYPEGTSEFILEKAERHSAFDKALRQFLRKDINGLETPFRIINAIKIEDKRTQSLWGVYEAAHFDGERPEKEREEIWLNDWKIDQCRKWILKHKEGIIWFAWNFMGETLNRILSQEFDNIKYCPANCKDEDLRGTGNIVIASSRAHGTGKNLQQYSKNLFLEWSSNAKTNEQIIGRTHRQGQKADNVLCTFSCSSSPEKWRMYKLIKHARFIEETGAGAQKLLFADFTETKFAKVSRNSKVDIDTSKYEHIL